MIIQTNQKKKGRNGNSHILAPISEQDDNATSSEGKVVRELTIRTTGNNRDQNLAVDRYYDEKNGHKV
jgi:hypothetical protein